MRPEGIAFFLTSIGGVTLIIGFCSIRGTPSPSRVASSSMATSSSLTVDAASGFDDGFGIFFDSTAFGGAEDELAASS